MKRWISLFLALLMTALAVFPAAAASDSSVKLTDYGPCNTVDEILEAGEAALEAGAASKSVLSAMVARANAKNLQNQFTYTCENIAAYNSAQYKKLDPLVGEEQERWHLDVETAPAAEDDGKGWDAYAAIDVTDAMRALLKDSGAQFCFPPAFWPEAQFKSKLGTEYKKFKPSRARPGYACVVIKNGAQAAPRTAWNDDDNDEFIEALEASVGNLIIQLGKDAPVLTGNPHLASTFWVFNLTYPFYAKYGDRSSRQVEGFDCNISLTVVNASTKKTIGEVKTSKRLPNTIYEWSNWIAKPDTPLLSSLSSYKSFANKVRESLKKDIATAAASQKITALNAETTLNGILLQQAKKASNGWQKAIYESGVQNVTLENNTLTFYLRGYDPKLGDLGEYSKAQDKNDWLWSALKNASGYRVKVSLSVANGKLPEKSLTKLKSAVKNAADSAQKAFAGKDMTAALKKALFPVPMSKTAENTSQVLEPAASFVNQIHFREESPYGSAPDAALSALFYAQKSQTVNVKAGPHAIKISCVGASAGTLLSAAAKTVKDKMAYAAQAKRTPDQLEKMLLEALADGAMKEKSKGTGKYSLTLDIDQLLQYTFPADYTKNISSFSYQKTLDTLQEEVDNLPAEAAQSLPKNGIMSGGKSGQPVTVKVEDASNYTYVQFRNEKTNKLVATAFIHPNKQVSMKIPAGNYIILYCSGPYWYGEKLMFNVAPHGSYSKTGTETVKKNYKHTYTIYTKNEGNTDTYPANPSEFAQDE